MTAEKAVKYVRTKLTLKTGQKFSRNHPQVRQLFAHMEGQGLKFHDKSEEGNVVTLRFAPIYPAMADELELKSVHKVFKKK